MCATVVASNIWHPAVLNLLPFSQNDAAFLSRDSMHAPVTMIHQSCPSLPALAVTRPPLEHGSTTSNDQSSTSSDSLSTTYTSKTASSKTRPDTLTVPSGQPIYRQSRSLSSRDKVTSENKWILSNSQDLVSTKFELNVNDRFKRTSDEDSSKTDVGKSLPKPVFKPTQQWKLYDHKRRNYQTANEEMESERHKVNMNLEQSLGFQHATRRLKVNVKELPRSRTPIAENDPDKLNMNQVIAFLQANKVVTGRECQEKIVDTVEQVSSANPAHLSKRLSLNSANTAQLSKRLSLNSASSHARSTEGVYDKKQQIIKLIPSWSNPNSTSALVNANQMSPDRHTTSRRTSCNSESSTNTFAQGSPERAFRHPSPRPARGRGGVIYQHGSKVIHVDVSQQLDQSKRSTSSNRRQINVKASDKHKLSDICKSKDNNTQISYRLNRYPGLGKDESKTIPNGLQDHQGCLADSAKEAPPCASSVADVCKHSQQLYTSSSSLPRVRDNNNRLMNTQGVRSHSKYSHIPCTDQERTLNKNKIICLPTAQLEPDSDEESCLPSNVGREQKPDATLPATHCAIIKAGNTASPESSSYTNTTTVELRTSLIGPEPTQDNININVENAVLNEKVDDELHFQTVRTKLNELSTRLAESSLSVLPQPVTTAADIAVDGTSREQLLKLTNHETHLHTLFRFLNNDLITMTRTRHWLEDHSTLFPPVICKHKDCDESQVPTGSKEQIRLSLRKERSKTRVHTYMTDIGQRHDEQ